MASMREIKRRKDSIANTQQITKAMKLVATVKLQKARGKAEEGKPYSEFVYNVVKSILAKTPGIDHPYLKSGNGGKYAAIVITSNRGLAGGYNSNLVKLVTQKNWPKDQVEIYAIGRKGRDSLERQGYKIAEDYSEVINEPLYKDAMEIGSKLLKEYRNGQVGEIHLFYTSFKNTVTHIPTVKRLLPVEDMSGEQIPADTQAIMNYEPDEETVLNAVIPKYMTSLIYGALLESLASENGARMAAMDAATGNAEEMIEELALLYNRARQGTITQELTEIIAGAQAIQ